MNGWNQAFRFFNIKELRGKEINEIRWCHFRNAKLTSDWECRLEFMDTLALYIIFVGVFFLQRIKTMNYYGLVITSFDIKTRMIIVVLPCLKKMYSHLVLQVQYKTLYKSTKHFGWNSLNFKPILAFKWFSQKKMATNYWYETIRFRWWVQYFK